MSIDRKHSEETRNIEEHEHARRRAFSFDQNNHLARSTFETFGLWTDEEVIDIDEANSCDKTSIHVSVPATAILCQAVSNLSEV